VQLLTNFSSRLLSKERTRNLPEKQLELVEDYYNKTMIENPPKGERIVKSVYGNAFSLCQSEWSWLTTTIEEIIL
jgi:hypothetical protein